MTKKRILGIIGVCLCVLIAVLNYLTVDATIRMKGDPGPRIFPYMTAIMFGVTGLILLFEKPEEQEKVFLKPDQWKRLFVLFFVLCIYIGVIWLIGFNLATMLMLFAVSTMFAKGQNVSLKQRAAYSILMTVIIFLVFRFGLKIYLPKGLLNLI